MLWFQGRLRGLSRAEAKRRAAAVLERVGLAERARSLIGRLSKGQRQRVGLAVALLPDPEVLVLDEPTSGLDPLQRIEVRGLIRELAKERTVLLSSHILPEIEATCPRVIMLQRGRIAADGTQQDLVERLGGGSFVRFELGGTAGAEAARGEVARLAGVRAVDARAAEDGWVSLEVRGEGDLRSVLGGHAHQRGWTVRELSWQRPTLEQLFARIALELDPSRAGEPGPAAEGAA
jgi:ABC-2 type transport system ATP-binding protein